MAFNLNIPTQADEALPLQLEAGQVLFVLGANGTGKSSLIHRFARLNQDNVRKIAAHRQTWMNTDALDMTPADKLQTEDQIKMGDTCQESRYRDPFAGRRTSVTIYELIDAENVRARAMQGAYDAGNMESLQKAAKEEAPIAIINELLLQSSIPIKISIQKNERVMASKGGGHEYSVTELSDGERNVLLIAGNVLTAPQGTLLIIDEPERHLHRSIISPLLSQLFARRRDCGFVISTHHHDLPLEVPDARTLLLRSCSFNGKNAQIWEADELPAECPIDNKLKRDLLGARRKILFVEGTGSSLDKPLYSQIFPMVSVISKGSCRDVERAVVGCRAGESFHWLRAFGIADGDGLSQDQVATKRERGVYILPFYSVEAIYYHPRIVDYIAARQADVSGADAAEMSKLALAAGVAAVSGQTDRLSRKVAKKAARKHIEEQIPSDDDLLAGNEVTVVNDSVAIHKARRGELDAAVKAKDWNAVLTRCPVRESGALDKISTALNFRRTEDYERAVRHLLSSDASALDFVRKLFGDLFDELDG